MAQSLCNSVTDISTIVPTVESISSLSQIIAQITTPDSEPLSPNFNFNLADIELLDVNFRILVYSIMEFMKIYHVK